MSGLGDTVAKALLDPASLAAAIELAQQGKAYWDSFHAKALAHDLTQADLDAAASKLDVEFADLVRARQEQLSRQAALKLQQAGAGAAAGLSGDGGPA